MCVFLHAVITKHKKQRASLLLPLAVRKTECVCRPEWRRSPAANYSSGGKKGRSNGERSARSANELENGSIKKLLRWMKVIGSRSRFLLVPDQTKQRPLYFCSKGEIISRALSEGKTAPEDAIDPETWALKQRSRFLRGSSHVWKGQCLSVGADKGRSSHTENRISSFCSSVSRLTWWPDIITWDTLKMTYSPKQLWNG